jgi:hypothetical protein
MDYRLENLSDDDFEELINTLCQRFLGTGVVSFTKGRDGGKDGRLTGTANSYPSKSATWSGKLPKKICKKNPIFIIVLFSKFNPKKSREMLGYVECRGIFIF